MKILFTKMMHAILTWIIGILSKWVVKFKIMEMKRPAISDSAFPEKAKTKKDFQPGGSCGAGPIGRGCGVALIHVKKPIKKAKPKNISVSSTTVKKGPGRPKKQTQVVNIIPEVMAKATLDSVFPNKTLPKVAEKVYAEKVDDGSETK